MVDWKNPVVFGIPGKTLVGVFTLRGKATVELSTNLVPLPLARVGTQELARRRKSHDSAK